MIKRWFDILTTFTGLVLLLPFLIVIALAIIADSRGGVFYRQVRVGRGGKKFGLYKFRTMVPDADKQGQLTVGGRDPRVTAVGHFLRTYKLDELPQFINILAGDMSVVGPRPEVPRYVNLYTTAQKKVLTVRPGLTDYASLEFINESEILGRSNDPEQCYIAEVMPAKLQLNLRYIREAGFFTDLRIIFRTMVKIIR